VLQPFAPDLRAPASRDETREEPYFADVKVKDSFGDEHPIVTKLREVRGRVVLQGQSGLGKTVFLRELVKRASRPIVYLEARGCDEGVIAAIGRHVPGALGDRNFLERLVLSGGLDVCIDGLNEASVETRTKIHHFFEAARRANVLITTQPLEWSSPAGSRLYELQPLREEQIREFLLHQAKHSDLAEPLGYAAFEVACNRYLEGLRAHGQQDALWNEMASILSNPMDLTVVARLLARGVWPDLLQLQRQQFEVMEHETYAKRNGGAPFPMARFGEAVYVARCAQIYRVPEGFPEEVLALREQKMIVGREVPPESGDSKWVYYFRHEKIVDFIISEYLAGPGPEKMYDHIADPRFRGAYLLLASELSAERAAELKDVLVEYAAMSGDHTLSDAYVLRHRAWVQLRKEYDTWTTERTTPGPPN